MWLKWDGDVGVVVMGWGSGCGYDEMELPYSACGCDGMEEWV